MDMVSASWAVYAAYMISAPVWLLCVARGFLRQRVHDKVVPQEWEFIGLRLFAFYAMTDLVRAVDLCFATDAHMTDGACRSTWGLLPLSIRVVLWWARDITMLVSLAFFLDFTVGWTHTLLNRHPPSWLAAITRVGVPSICIGMSGCAVGLVMTNRAVWIFGLIAWVALLNIGTAAIGWKLLWSILPDVRRHLGGVARPEADMLVFQARVVAVGMLVLAAAIFAGFLPIFALRLREGAVSWPMVPSRPLGVYIGDTHFSALSSMPVGVTPNPGPECVEMMIGWALLFGCVLSAKGCSGMQTSACGYVTRRELGVALLKGTAYGSNSKAE